MFTRQCAKARRVFADRIPPFDMRMLRAASFIVASRDASVRPPAST